MLRLRACVDATTQLYAVNRAAFYNLEQNLTGAQVANMTTTRPSLLDRDARSNLIIPFFLLT